MLCDNLEGWAGGGLGGREVQRAGTYVYLQRVHAVEWWKPTRRCKAIILQLKIKNKKMPQVR